MFATRIFSHRRPAVPAFQQIKTTSRRLQSDRVESQQGNLVFFMRVLCKNQLLDVCTGRTGPTALSESVSFVRQPAAKGFFHTFSGPRLSVWVRVNVYV